jgi:GH24 family phage-related lysozyme (muramidase)
MINEKDDIHNITNWWRTHYITGGDVILSGLVKRRASEAYLFEHGELDFK